MRGPGAPLTIEGAWGAMLEVGSQPGKGRKLFSRTQLLDAHLPKWANPWSAWIVGYLTFSRFNSLLPLRCFVYLFILLECS